MDKTGIYLEAERERAKGNYDEAVALYRQAIDVDPQDWKLRESLADHLESGGEIRAALKELFQAAHGLIHLGSHEEATRLLKKMLRMDPAKEFDVTKGVMGSLEEIERAARERAANAAAEGPGEILEALVESDSSTGFRVPDDILSLLDRVPQARTTERHLLLDVDGAKLKVSGREYRIGSADDCHLVLKQKGIAARHARILEMDGRYFVMDWDVAGAVLVNGQPGDGQELQDGDVLTFGESGIKATAAFSGPTAS